MSDRTGVARLFRASPTLAVFAFASLLGSCASRPGIVATSGGKPAKPGTSTATTLAPANPATTVATTTTSTTPPLPAAFSPSPSRPAPTHPWRLDPLPEATALSHEVRLPELEALVRSALAFSGLEGDTLRLRTARILSLARSEASKVAGIAAPAAKAEKLLLSMHDTYLRRYSGHQSSLDLAFSAGEFNCVSSAVMFLVFARAAGLEVSGISTADHAFCVLAVPGGSIDVETTTRYGFDPGSKKNFSDSFGKVTGFAYVPPKNYAGRTAISAKRLVTLILSNRISEADRGDRFLPSVGPGVDYFVSEKDKDSKDFMFTRFRNAAGELSNSGDYRSALEFVNEARGKYGEEPGLDRIARVAVDNWLGELGKSGDWNRGLDLILANPTYSEKSTRSAEFVRTATHNQVLALTKSGDFEAARRLIASRTASGLIPATEHGRYEDIIGMALYNRAQDSRDYASGMADLSAAEVRAAVKPADLENARLYLASREAGRLEKKQSALDAWKFLSGAGLADTAKFRELTGVYRSNAIVESHNRFVSLFNAKRYAEAKNSLLASLAIFPGEANLLKDLELLRTVSGLR